MCFVLRTYNLYNEHVDHFIHFLCINLYQLAINGGIRETESSLPSTSWFEFSIVRISKICHEVTKSRNRCQCLVSAVLWRRWVSDDFNNWAVLAAKKWDKKGFKFACCAIQYPLHTCKRRGSHIILWRRHLTWRSKSHLPVAGICKKWTQWTASSFQINVKSQIQVA